jgi:TPR repeat protein
MKIKKHLLNLVARILWVYSLQLLAADSTNNATVQESWETISNRWGSVPLEKITQSAEHGEVTAQYYLGCAYKDGNGVEKDMVESFKWVNLAAQQGLARAQRNLGWDYENGFGVETNPSEAVIWYQKAAQQGDAQAQFNLGWMYENGVNVSQDYGKAAKFYRLAAEQGHSMAQNNLGWLYFHLHEGVPQNSDEGIKWFQKSAEQGETLGEENLARSYAMLGYTNFAAAEAWMRKAVDLNSAEGQYKFADFLCSQSDKDGHQVTTNFPVAAEWYRKAAEQGLAEAQYELADMYHSGELGDDQRSNCIPWFLKAAAQGNAEAQAAVGELSKYYPNSELLKSVNNIEILRRSGQQGNLDAQFQLARRYQAGDGVPQDSVEAFKWMQMAAQQDQTKSSRASDALYDLALMYEKGEGVTNDLSKAHDLFIQAAAGHQSDATFRVGQMYEKGDGVPQDDHRAMEFYCNKIYDMNYPDKYPNGYVEYGGPGDEAVESLLNLWSQGRGFPDVNDKAEPGYHEPLELIKGWEAGITSAKAELYLGEIYYQGKLVPQDFVEAAARFRVAANQNLEDARKMSAELEAKLSPEQMEATKSRFDALEKQFKQAKQTQEAIEKAKSVILW